MTYDPLVLTHLSTYLQRIADYVRLGYRHWVGGEIAADKARTFIRKFDARYGVGRSRHQRAWARQKGEAGAVLLLYAPSAARRPTTGETGQTADTRALTSDRGCPTLYWMLLITAGEHVAQRLETLQDATTPGGRLGFHGYELVQLPRPGQAAPSWTWRMSEAQYHGWRARLIEAARREARRLPEEIARLIKTPGFSGCRKQVKKLLQLARGEYRRRHPGETALVLPPVRYMQRQASGNLSLSQCLRDARCDQGLSRLRASERLL